MSRILAAFVLVALLAARPASAASAPATAPAPADTLALPIDDAIRLALAQGEEMRIAHSSVTEARGRVREAVANALPKVDGTFTYNRKLSSVFQLDPRDTIFTPLLKNSAFAAPYAWTSELSGSWLVYSSGKVGAALAGAKALRLNTLATEAESGAQVTLAVRQAYYQAAYQQRLVEIAEGGLTQARAHLAQVGLYRGQGTRSEYDLLRAQVDAANQEPAVVAARQGRDVALLELKRLVSVPLERPVRLTSALDFEGEGVPVPAEPALAAPRRHALEAAEADVEFNRQNVRFSKGRRGFDVTLQSTLSHSAYTSEEEFPDRRRFARGWDASVKLTLPLFDGFRVAGQVDQAQAQYDRAQATRDRLRRQTEVDLAEAHSDLARTLSELAARRETVRQARRAHELADVRFRNGLSTQLEVSDARLQLQTSQVNEVLAARDYRLALARLEAILGHPVSLVNKPLESVTQTPQEGE